MTATRRLSASHRASVKHSIILPCWARAVPCPAGREASAVALATAASSRPGSPCTDNSGLSTQILDARVKPTSSETTSQELVRVCSEAIERPGDIG
jgi:hypothetical protein